MRKSVLAISLLAVRSAVRSRMVAALLVFVLAAVLLLPSSLKGDGTLEGRVRITLTYALGLAVFLLGLATLWASCAAISQDVRDKQIQLVSTKPVRPIQIWLGKWLGLLWLNAVMLGFAGLAVFGTVRWEMRGAADEDRRAVRTDVMTSRRLLPPAIPSLDGATRERYAHLLQAQPLLRNVPLREALQVARNQVLAERAVVGPGRAKEWPFDLPRRLPTGTAASLRYQFAPVGTDARTVSGRWTFTSAAAPAGIDVPVERQAGGLHTVEVPRAVLAPGAALRVRFVNAEAETSTTAVFSLDDGVQLLIRESTFEANLLRALIVLFCYLALLGALGLTAGALFSFPVAAFAASAVLVIAALTHWSATSVGMEGEEEEHGGGSRRAPPSLLYRASEQTLDRLRFAVEPAVNLNPLGRLSDGILVSWLFTGRAVGLLLLAYPAVLALVGAAALGRRELALPGD